MTSVTVTGKFSVPMEILQNPYDNKRLILSSFMELSRIEQCLQKIPEICENLSTRWNIRLSLLNMGQPMEHRDPFFVYVIKEKLLSEKRKFWEERIQALESAAPTSSLIINDKRSHQHQNYPQNQLNTHMTTMNQYCECCEGHRLFKCGHFKKLGVKDQAQLIKVEGLFQLSSTRIPITKVRWFVVPTM